VRCLDKFTNRLCQTSWLDMSQSKDDRGIHCLLCLFFDTALVSVLQLLFPLAKRFKYFSRYVWPQYTDQSYLRLLCLVRFQSYAYNFNETVQTMQYVDIYDRVFVQATMTVYKSTHSFLNTNFTKILQRLCQTSWLDVWPRDSLWVNAPRNCLTIKTIEASQIETCKYDKIWLEILCVD
jgi:hypothetical protein